ncbi:DUF397 domain-containing protein [Yinghuangia sp. ASG 101]|uniref:DUF397 domain-containing protein n=1 Tax=Yinghuangia sp. ASG 101 TaxID=2896848 RepID=UPI001E56F017|nr:DUF397 domain-containing protein [Yinghuangia sp. ASG 101]UGQ11276.1 DUF397 domain-containing protein [Yinghuangia sp. ASG 101]
MNDERPEDQSRLTWVKSSYSGTSGGECVEVATAPRTTHVRDSKTVGPMLSFEAPTWSVFLGETARHANG